jgi:PAS domain S-box-containing protein
MNADEQHRPSGWVDHIPQAVSAVAIVVGVLVLIGWRFDLETLKSTLTGFPSMKANAALGFIFAGISLWGSHIDKGPRWRIVSQACAAVVTLIGLLTLGEYLSGIDFGIDRLLIKETTDFSGDMPGRMAIYAAVSFAALGAALWLLNTEKNSMVVAIHALALAPIIAAGSVLVGYAYAIEEFLQVKPDYNPLSLNTSALLVLFGLGVVSACPDYPFRRFMISDGAAGVTVRRLLPATIGFTLMIGWLIQQGYRAGYFRETFGLALFTLVSIAGLGALILWNAGKLYEVSAQRERAEEERRNASQYARSLIEASLDPLVTISAAGKITDVNEATVQATGVTREALIGSDFSDYFTEPEKARAGYLEVFAKGTITDYSLTLRHVSGKVTGVLYNASVYRNMQGEVMGVFAAARDITELKQAEEKNRQLNNELEQRVAIRTAELEAANSDLEGFAYSVSHDLRTPLRAIDGFSQQLLKRYSNTLDDEGKRYLNLVRGNTNKMSQLIDDILAFSRLGRLGMSESVVDMEALVSEGFEALKPSVAGRELTLEIKPLPHCRGDAAMLRQVWANLLSNAIKFTRFKAVALVEVGGRAEGAENIYYIKDNGAGFDMQYATKLFGVFERLHGNEEFEGTGIGLAIVNRIVTRHDGRVWAEGKVNEGATFYFALPI